MFDHVHNLNGKVSILLAEESNKAMALVLASVSVFWHEAVGHWPYLEKELQQQWVHYFWQSYEKTPIDSALQL